MAITIKPKYILELDSDSASSDIDSERTVKKAFEDSEENIKKEIRNDFKNLFRYCSNIHLLNNVVLDSRHKK